MPSKTTPEDARSLSATKGAATLRRRREEQRAERLDQIHDQIADGTLVVRQMTAAQHKEAAKAARRTLARNQARREFNTATRPRPSI